MEDLFAGRTTLEAQHGMHQVSADWNGLSMAYDVSAEDGFGFDCPVFRGEHVAELQMPGLCARGQGCVPEQKLVRLVGYG